MTVAAAGHRTFLSVQEEPMHRWLQNLALVPKICLGTHRRSQTGVWERGLGWIVAAMLGLAGSAARAEPPGGTAPALYPNCPPAPCYTLPPPCEGVVPPGQPLPPGQPGHPETAAAPTDVAALPSRGGGAGIGSSAELDPGYIDPAAA